MKTLTEQYRLIKEDKGHKGVFLKEAKAKYPSLITNASTFNEASTILKQKGIISENYVDLQPINNPLERKKEGYETAFANFLAEAEAKAEEKKVSKEVEEDAEKNYDYKDKKDPNNMIFGQIQMGYYFEMKQEKNADKTIDEIKDIVFKNLAKDPIYYTKNGQFGVEVGYTDDNVALGEPIEAKGEYKSSGYGKLKENKILKEEKYSGAIIRKGSNNKAKEDTKIVRQALKDKGIKFTNRGEFGMDFKDADLAQIKKVIADAKVGEFIISHDEDKSKEPVNEIAIAGGLVTGGGFTSANYMDFYGLHEEDEKTIPSKDKVKATTAELNDLNLSLEKTKELVGEDEIKENFENEMADALATQAEEILRDAEARGEDLNIDKVLDMVMGDMRGLLKQHLEIFVNDLM